MFILDISQEISDTLVQTTAVVFSVHHIPPNFSLADLQDRLSSPAYFDEEYEETTTRDFIAGYTETSGPDHYDSGIPSAMSLLARLEFYNNSFVADFLYRTAEGILDVGEYVLTYFAEELIGEVVERYAPAEEYKAGEAVQIVLVTDDVIPVEFDDQGMPTKLKKTKAVFVVQAAVLEGGMTAQLGNGQVFPLIEGRVFRAVDIAIAKA